MAQKFFILAVFVIACMHQIDAGPLSTIDKAVFEKMISTLQKSRDIISEKIESVREKFNRIGTQAYNDLDEKNKYYDDLLQNVTEVPKNGKPISDECTNVFNDYRTAYYNIIKETRACINKEIVLGVYYVEEVCNEADGLITALNQLSDEARECRDAVKGGFISGAVASISCGTTFVAKSNALQTIEFIPIMNKLAQAGLYLAQFAPKIAYCASMETIKNVNTEMLTQLDYCL